MDWLSALDVLNKRLDTLERKQRNSFQTNNQANASMRKVLNQFVTDEADVVEYEKYAQNRFANMETVVSDELSKVRGIIDGQIVQNFEALQERCKLTSALLESLTNSMSKIASCPAATTMMSEHHSVETPRAPPG